MMIVVPTTNHVVPGIKFLMFVDTRKLTRHIEANKHVPRFDATIRSGGDTHQQREGCC